MAVAGGTQNRDLAEDGVQGLISPLTGKQVCPSALDPGPPWSPCHPAYVATVPKVSHAFLLMTHPPTEDSAPSVPSPR